MRIFDIFFAHFNNKKASFSFNYIDRIHYDTKYTIIHTDVAAAMRHAGTGIYIDGTCG